MCVVMVIHLLDVVHVISEDTVEKSNLERWNTKADNVSYAGIKHV
jgi:hypothetical protein